MSVGKSRWRRLVATAGVLIALPVVLLIVATALIPRDRLVAEIAAQVTAATGAQLEPGQVSLKLAGGLGLTLSDGRLQGTGAELMRRTGTGQDIGAYELEYSRLEVSLALWPLLRHQFLVKAMRLQGPGLLVEVGGDPIRLRRYDFRVTDLRFGPAAAPVQIGGPPGERIPEDLFFQLRAQADGLVEQGTPWQAVRLSGTWAERRFQIAEVTAGLGGGTVTASGSLDYAGDPWGRLAWTVQLAEVPADLLLAPYLPELGSRLDCALTADATGSMALRDPAIRQQSLTLTGLATAADGVLRAEDWLQDVSRYLGARQDLKTVGFSRFSHRFAVVESRYVIDTLEIDGYDSDWQASGSLGFVGDIDLNVGVLLPVGFTPDLGAMSFLAETLRDDDGRVRLGLKLTGQTAAPTIGLDLAGVGRRR